MKRISILTVLVSLIISITAYAQTSETDSTKTCLKQVSLLTCSPGEEIYSLFGHTAIRYRNQEDGTDIVFNYGIFSFDTPNFIWRFIKGETDYLLGISHYIYFANEYFYRNSSVYEQVLNLSEKQIDKLLAELMENYKPENRIYRYNFFYENCTTKARDKIEEATNGISYNKEMPELSFRDIIHQFTKGHEWSELGIDLCIGAEADKPITKREMMFSPFYYKYLLSYATFKDTGKPVAQKAVEIVIPEGENKESHVPSPMLCFGLLFILTIAITFTEYKRKCTIWIYDILLFGGTGICGMIIAFLVMFSTHPAVSPNYMLFFMHPLHLLLLPFFIRKEIKQVKSVYHMANAVVIMIFFMAIAIIPQQFNSAILFLALSLLVRSLYYTYKTGKSK